MKTLAALSVLFLLFPVLSHAQDCCGPGGGGGGTPFAASADGGGSYRLKGVRRYAYSTRHPGFTAGLESGGIGDKPAANFTPRIEYASTFGSLDVWGGAFYTVFLDAPHSHQIGLAENLAWRIAPTEHTRLVFRVDNEDVLVFFPGESGLKYAAVDPSAAWSAALGFGDISFSFGLPIVVTPETGSAGAWFTLGCEHPIGLGVSLCPRFSLLPDAAWSGATLSLTFAWDRFYAKAAFLANADCTVFQIRPYAEFTVQHIVLWAGVELDGLGAGDFSASPFAGVGYTF